MIGSLNKSYYFPVIVSTEDLKALADLLSHDFEELQYEINTKEGTRYTLNSIEEILNYSNPDDRKIQRICIKGNKEKDKNFIFPNISVSILDKSKYSKSFELEINKLEEPEICYYSQRVDEFTKRIKAPYWWLHKHTFYFISGILLYLLSAFLYLYNVDNTEPLNKVYNILALNSVGIICMFISMVVLEKIIFFFSPECCIAIGEQKKYKDKLDKRKALIFTTIIATLILGTLSSIIAYYIIQCFV